jgi:hypothetical protein
METIETIMLSQRFPGLDPNSSDGMSTRLPCHGGDSWSQVDKSEQQNFGPTRRIEAYPDSNPARVNKQRRSVPVDLISKTTTPLSISAPSRSQVKSSHEVNRSASPQPNRWRAHRANTLHPTTRSSPSALISRPQASVVERLERLRATKE